MFSGRPDPVWVVGDEDVDALLRDWESLDAAGDAVATPPPLGYRGCTLRAPDGRVWLAYRGVVALTEGGEETRRADASRGFEQRLLRTAPPGLLPPSLP